MVRRNDALTKTLAVAGTIGVTVPILAPFLFGIMFYLRSHRAGFDWLMPAELFPAVLLGGALLLAAALRAGVHRGLVGWGLGAAVVLLVGGQALAVVTGLASGATKPEGLPWLLVTLTIALYAAAVIELAVAGVLLCRDLFGERAIKVPAAE